MNFRALPKIDLHRHLEGSVRFETLVELARDVGLDLPVRELRRRACMRGEKPGLERFLSKFEIYRGLYPSRDWIERVAFEAAEDADKDGVVYLELRFSPTHFGRRMKAKGEDVAEWVARGARRAGIDVTFIATYGREFAPEGNRPTTRAVEGTDLFAGLDLAGNEACPAAPFLPLFKRLKLPSTIHAGESGGAENVAEAVVSFGARRIGHGVRVLEDGAAVDLCRGLDVVFETCLTSEIQTGVARSWRRHPALQMLQRGLRVTLNSDDPAICGVPLSVDYAKAAASGWSAEELETARRESVRAAFLGAGGRRALAKRMARTAPKAARST